ncbi:hypothetical protein D3C76_265800 [compost metagenome]
MQILFNLIQHYSTFFHIIYDEYTYPNRATSCYEKAKSQQKLQPSFNIAKCNHPRPIAGNSG